MTTRDYISKHLLPLTVAFALGMLTGAIVTNMLWLWLLKVFG